MAEEISKARSAAGVQKKPAVDASKRSRPAAAAKAAAPIVKSIESAADAAGAAAKAVARDIAEAPAKVAGTVRHKPRRSTPTRPGRGGSAAILGAAAGLVTGLAVNLGRKVMVQAPSALAGDWLDAVKTEHAMALALFDTLQATNDDQPAKRTVLLTQLKHALGKHAFMEENVLYPALRQWGDKADADKLNHDHGYVKQYLYELESLDRKSPEFLALVARFRADLEAHIREEESAVFPPLHAALGAEGNQRLTTLANKEGLKLA